MKDIYDFGEVSDRLAIYDMYARYVHGVDSHDHVALDDVFDPDTVFDYTDTGYKVMTWEEAKRDEMFAVEFMFHTNSDFVIEFGEDRLTAEVKQHTIQPCVMPQPNGVEQTFQVHGGYADKLVRYEDRWKIKHRVWTKAFYYTGGDVVPSMAAMLEWNQ